MRPIPNRHFARLDGLPEITESFFYYQPGIVCLGRPRVMNQDPMPISILAGKLIKAQSYHAKRVPGV